MPNDKEIAAMSSAELVEYMGTDASRWTEGFLIHTDLANAGPDFASTVQSWFANAIERGRLDNEAAALEHMKIAAREKGLDTSDLYTSDQLVQKLYDELPGDHSCL